MDGQVRDGLQGSKVGLLPLRLRGITWAVGNDGGEVANAVYTVLGQQKPRQPPDIQPTILRAPQCAIVEIEAVNVDVGADREQSP